MLLTIVLVVLIVLIVLCVYVICVVIPKGEQLILHKKFNELELNSSWIRRTESTNPFNTTKVRVLAKQMGTDGKTPWIIIERQSGYKDYMKFEDFINLYTQI